MSKFFLATRRVMSVEHRTYLVRYRDRYLGDVFASYDEVYTPEEVGGLGKLSFIKPTSIPPRFLAPLRRTLAECSCEE